jgi:L-amino acid N-acyltransferase
MRAFSVCDGLAFDPLLPDVSTRRSIVRHTPVPLGGFSAGKCKSPIMTNPILRDATEADLPAILAIYNHAVAETTAIWNETLVDLDNRKAWFEARQARGFPILVTEIDGRIAGYASYGDWRAFDGFRQSVEHSVYVEKDFYGRGLGKALMTALIESARAGNIHVMIAAIEAGNTGSIALHKSLGFRLVGTHHEVGQKFGRWLDLTMMELKLGE